MRWSLWPNGSAGTLRRGFAPLSPNSCRCKNVRQQGRQMGNQSGVELPDHGQDAGLDGFGQVMSTGLGLTTFWPCFRASFPPAESALKGWRRRAVSLWLDKPCVSGVTDS